MSKASKVIAAFIDVDSRDASKSAYNWLRFAHSTTLTISDNPETEDKDYIADETKTTEIKSYSPAFEQDIAIDKTHSDWAFFNKLRHEYPTYGDAHYNILTCYLMEELAENVYYAEVQDSTVQFTDMNSTDALIDLTISLCGTRKRGYVTMAAGVPTFTEGEYPTA